MIYLAQWGVCGHCTGRPGFESYFSHLTIIFGKLTSPNLSFLLYIMKILIPVFLELLWRLNVLILWSAWQALNTFYVSLLMTPHASLYKGHSPCSLWLSGVLPVSPLCLLCNLSFPSLSLPHLWSFLLPQVSASWQLLALLPTTRPSYSECILIGYSVKLLQCMFT